MNTAPQKTEKARIAAVREALRARYGSGNHRITGHEGYRTVSVYSKMPNSNQIGWWLIGDLLAAEMWLGLA